MKTTGPRLVSRHTYRPISGDVVWNGETETTRVLEGNPEPADKVVVIGGLDSMRARRARVEVHENFAKAYSEKFGQSRERSEKSAASFINKLLELNGDWWIKDLARHCRPEAYYKYIRIAHGGGGFSRELLVVIRVPDLTIKEDKTRWKKRS